MEQIKFYADGPDGVSNNKLLCYKVKNISHSLDLLKRFKDKGWNIRRAYHHFSDGREIRITKELLNNELFNTEL